MSPHSANTKTNAWQQSWDRQQEAYMPDREHRLTAILDVVEAVLETPDRSTGTEPPRLLDLAGGTGSITLRALARFPYARITLVDIDPVLLAIARASVGDRATVVGTNLNHPEWTRSLPHRDYDAVLTATALHWMPPDRLTVLYREIHALLRSGGVFINVDHMPDDALPALTKHLLAHADARRAAQHATGAAMSWPGWWQLVAADPDLAPLAEQRKAIYPEGHSAEWSPPAGWHLDALRAAGFAEAGIVWRGGTDAAVAALR